MHRCEAGVELPRGGAPCPQCGAGESDRCGLAGAAVRGGMVDIVDRLLEAGEFSGFSDAAEAADEIERLRAEVETLLALLATERGCSECWRGVVCGSDCRMADVAALAAAGVSPR